ncbi:hypothetical protein EDD96_3038 [Streptomyces sp. Ag109_G2-6]|nr:hypothetical protein EDD96_3038 [Streptomyces sp. Ag109_G2-6]
MRVHGLFGRVCTMRLSVSTVGVCSLRVFWSWR